MPVSALADRLDQVRQRVTQCQAARGDAGAPPVRIIAVTKGHGADVVRQAATVGLGCIGENRVQEALAKQDACTDLPLEWHLIGGLQRNKVRRIVGRFALIHSVDRLELAQEIARLQRGHDPQPVLVQVNCSDELQKGGVTAAGLEALLDALRALSGLEVRGLMTMAAETGDERVQRQAFARLRGLRDRMNERGHALHELSMGMSDDYPAAVAEGATMIRLGRALFGDRG